MEYLHRVTFINNFVHLPFTFNTTLHKCQTQSYYREKLRRKENSLTFQVIASRTRTKLLMTAYSPLRIASSELGL